MERLIALGKRRSGAERVGAFSALLLAVALLLYLPTIGWGPLLPGGPVPWWAVAVIFCLAEIFVVHLQFRREHHSFSLSELPLVLGLCFVAPVLLLPLRLLGSFVALRFHRRSPPMKLALNLSSFALEVAVAQLVIRALLQPGSAFGPESWFVVVLAMAITGCIGVANVTAAVSLFEGSPSTSGVRRHLASALVGGLTNTILALVCVALLVVDPRSGWLVAALAAVLIVVYHSYAVLLRRHESLELLHGFTERVGATLTAEASIRQMLSEAREVVKAEVAELTLLRDDGIAVRSRLEGDGELTRIEFAADELTSAAWHLVVAQGVAARTGHGLLRVPELEERGIQEALVAPLRVDGRVVGKLLVGNRLGRVIAFDDGDLRLFEAVANHASVALENVRLLERLRQEATEKAHQALHDSLTGLPNRQLFHERVAGALAGQSATGGSVAVLLLDLDRFKEVNDTLGHHNGDRLLQHVATRLRAVLRAGDTVARLGGDEFAVLLPDVSGRQAAISTAESLVSLLEQPVVLSDLSLEVGASVGIALAPDHGLDPDALLQRADVAMYAAKAASSAVEVYEPTTDPYSPERLGLAGELRQAIEAGALDVHYQLKVDISTGTIEGVEALVRWDHPTRGIIGPDEFVPMAEHTGLIRPLTKLVLERAVEQCATWRREGHDLGVAVNLSMRDLLDPDLPMNVGTVLERHRLPAEALTLELTESMIMSDPIRMTVLLDMLAGMGVQLAIDDFGTGYSSLSYLRRLPVKEIKIDRTFVLEVDDHDSDAAIVRSVVDLGRNLGLRVVAEGIEDQRTCERLAEMGCDQGQGFWLARPAAADVVGELLRDGVGRYRTRSVDLSVVPMRRRRQFAG